MFRKLWKPQEGVAALEMALIMPVIATILLIIIDTGLFFFDYVSAANATREGARCGAVGGADPVIEDRVAETYGFADPTLVVTDRTGGQIGDDIIVTTTFDHDWILPADVFTVPETFTLSTTMRLETDTINADQCGAGGGGGDDDDDDDD